MSFGDGISWDNHVDENIESGKKGAKIFYGEDTGASTFGDVKDLIKTDTPVDQRRALDCGCHMGRFIDAVEAYGFKYTGVDQSRKALDYAKEQRPNGDWVQSFLWEMSFKEEFDFAFTNAVLQHNLLSEQERIVPKIYDALKKGGIFLMTESTESVNTATQRTHEDWINMVEKFGFKLIKTLHKNPIGFDDKYIFIKN